MNALIGGCRVLDLDSGPLHSTSRDTEIVQPVIMPFSRRCHSDAEVPEDTLRLKLLYSP